jgi:hypothetical protein
MAAWRPAPFSTSGFFEKTFQDFTVKNGGVADQIILE